MLVLLAGGCSRSLTIQVDNTVPAALIESLPLTVAVYYHNSLRTHSYRENSEERANWSIATGSSQIAMFEQVWASTFNTVISLPQLPDADSPLSADLIVVPKIKEMQLGTPEETFFDFYEAWISYEISLLTAAGIPIENWEIVSYGKAEKKRFSSRSTGLNDAISLALRDAGAKLSTGIRKQGTIRALLHK
ncbi:MAG TPA: hypothetical protein DGR97_00610 [Gammaproteobacteria bacterium]|nr:hypothetical protein [Gammaproteobacteria bacterium]|tara:strand:+ start:237 stop:809 length:573 start_codon:yes stop_codon:yes gene_type:complete